MLPVSAGTWITDSTLLGQVVGVDAQGRYIVEDAHTDVMVDADLRLQTEAPKFKLTAAQIIHWFLVTPEPTEGTPSA